MLIVPVADMITTFEKEEVETVMVPALFGAPERRLKYTSPELPLTPAKVTFEIFAGVKMFIVSLLGSLEEKTVPLKIITLSD